MGTTSVPLAMVTGAPVGHGVGVRWPGCGRRPPLPHGRRRRGSGGPGVGCRRPGGRGGCGGWCWPGWARRCWGWLGSLPGGFGAAGHRPVGEALGRALGGLLAAFQAALARGRGRRWFGSLGGLAAAAAVSGGAGWRRRAGGGQPAGGATTTRTPTRADSAI